MTTLEKARDLGAQITTPEKAAAAVAATRETLRRARAQVGDLSWVDRAATAGKLSAAWTSRIDQQTGRLDSLAGKPFTRAEADKIGLAVVQSTGLLRDLQKAVAESQREATIGALLREFFAAMRTILEGAARAVAEAIPYPGWLGVALIAWLLLQRRAN
jgi:hypothetical protein